MATTVSNKSKWVPTRKWFAAAFSGVLTIAGTAVATGGWDAVEWGQLIALAIPLSTAYWMKNDPEIPVG